MQSNSTHKRIEQRNFEWSLLSELRDLERELRAAGLADWAVRLGEVAARAGRKYHQTASDLRRGAVLARNLPRSLAGVSPDHPIFGGKSPTIVVVERRRARHARPKNGDE